MFFKRNETGNSFFKHSTTYISGISFMSKILVTWTPLSYKIWFFIWETRIFGWHHLWEIWGLLFQIGQSTGSLFMIYISKRVTTTSSYKIWNPFIYIDHSLSVLTQIVVILQCKSWHSRVSNQKVVNEYAKYSISGPF